MRLDNLTNVTEIALPNLTGWIRLCNRIGTLTRTLQTYSRTLCRKGDEKAKLPECLSASAQSPRLISSPSIRRIPK